MNEFNGQLDKLKEHVSKKEKDINSGKDLIYGF